MTYIADMYRDEPEHLFIGIIRIIMGFVFLWPALDKLLGLGFGTSPDRAYIAGGSPTSFFLANVNPNGPFTSLFTDALGGMTAIVDIMYILTLGFAGITLMTGVLTRLGALAGAIFMQSILFANWHFSLPAGTVYNPLIDDHVVYFFILVLFVVVNTGSWIGFGERWKNIVGEDKWYLH